MKKVFYNKKGMSLMEILVGSLMFAMIAVTVSAVLAPMMMSFSRAADFAEYNTLLDNVGNRIASDLAKSSGIPTDLGELDMVGISINSENDVIYTISEAEGILLRNGTQVFPPGMYRNKRVSFIVFDTAPGFTIEVTVNPTDRPGTMGATISREYAVRPIRLIQD
jgi:hypothetical protein